MFKKKESRKTLLRGINVIYLKAINSALEGICIVAGKESQIGNMLPRIVGQSSGNYCNVCQVS